MATIYDVSKLANVSLATVSRVMNKNGRVTDKTKNKVLSAMKELGYRPNILAQSLASNCSNSIGVLVSELHGHFYGSMMSSIESELRTMNKYAIIAAGHSNEEDEKDGIEFLINRSCDALILHVEAVSDEYLIELSKGSTPFVLINRYIPKIAANCISINNENGGYLATKAILEKGHTDIAYISGPFWKDDAKQRLAGHKRALKEFDIEFPKELLFEGDFEESGGSAGMTHFIEQNLPVTAVVCANDQMASAAMTIARKHGITIPDELSFVGFDNTIYAHHLFPKLSTVNFPIREMGHMAVKWVLKNTYWKKNLNIQHIFQPEYISRDSVKTIVNNSTSR